MIGRAEQRSAQSVARDVVEVSFDRFGLGDVDLVKIALSSTKCVALEKWSIDRNGAVFAKLEKRNALRRGQLDIVTRRFLQKQSGQRKQRIRDGTGFDLLDDVFERRRTRQKFDCNRRQRFLRRRTPGRTVMSIFAMSIATARGLSIVLSRALGLCLF
jgi:hypothetical protein